ncbi:MICOS complex subunit MIC19-like [Liolophura sinensis]|uniref:MICOS complex subunit MIC19-like n=1 Tax=Liolophura sinensis TaxID=3198878 RepID=UPI0031599378
MGGSGSTRRVVVEEDSEGAGVVKISDSVVKRLKETGDFAGLPSPPEPREKPLPKPEKLPRFERDKHARDLEAFYQDKLRALEEKNALVYRTTKEQFAKAVEEVEQKFLKHTGSALCQDFQQQVYQCYKANSDKTLMCSPEVRQFTSCVETARQNALTRKG